MSELTWKDLRDTDYGVLKTLADSMGAYIGKMVEQSAVLTDDVVKHRLSSENYEGQTADLVRDQLSMIADNHLDDLDMYLKVKIKATLEEAHEELSAAQADFEEWIPKVDGRYRVEGDPSNYSMGISDGLYDQIENLSAPSDLMEQAGISGYNVNDDAGRREAKIALAEAAASAIPALEEVLQAFMNRARQADDNAAAILMSVIDEPAEQPPPLGKTYDDLIDDYKESNAKRESEFLEALASGDAEATPHGVSEWWESLSEEERAALIDSHPEQIGGLDGIPADVRSPVNYDLLAEQIENNGERISEIQAELDQMAADGSNMTDAEKYRDLQLELGELQTHQNNAESLQTALDAGVASGEDLYLLDFDTSEDGQAAVSVGNPDTADHTAVYVPGTTSNLEGVGGLIDDAAVLQEDAAYVASNGESTAVVMWLEYDAPDSAYPTHSGQIDPEAWHEDQALDGRESLDSFMEGIDASHDGEAHTTLVGHSYGSSVTGATARDYEVAADQIIGIGSPGLMVDQADALSVGGENTWSSRADGDIITAPAELPALGNDPVADEFGGQVFESDVIGGNAIEIHSGYLKDENGDPNSARESMALIITGQQPGDAS